MDGRRLERFVAKVLAGDQLVFRVTVAVFLGICGAAGLFWFGLTIGESRASPKPPTETKAAQPNGADVSSTASSPETHESPSESTSTTVAPTIAASTTTTTIATTTTISSTPAGATLADGEVWREPPSSLALGAVSFREVWLKNQTHENRRLISFGMKLTNIGNSPLRVEFLPSSLTAVDDVGRSIFLYCTDVSHGNGETYPLKVWRVLLAPGQGVDLCDGTPIADYSQAAKLLVASVDWLDRSRSSIFVSFTSADGGVQIQNAKWQLKPPGS